MPIASAASFLTPPELSSARRTVSRSVQSRFWRRLSEGRPVGGVLLAPRMRTTSGPMTGLGESRVDLLDVALGLMATVERDARAVRLAVACRYFTAC